MPDMSWQEANSRGKTTASAMYGAATTTRLVFCCAADRSHKEFISRIPVPKQDRRTAAVDPVVCQTGKPPPFCRRSALWRWPHPCWRVDRRGGTGDQAPPSSRCDDAFRSYRPAKSFRRPPIGVRDRLCIKPIHKGSAVRTKNACCSEPVRGSGFWHWRILDHLLDMIDQRPEGTQRST